MISYTCCVKCGILFDYAPVTDTLEQLLNYLNGHEHINDIPLLCEWCCDEEPPWPPLSRGDGEEPPEPPYQGG